MATLGYGAANRTYLVTLLDNCAEFHGPIILPRQITFFYNCTKHFFSACCNTHHCTVFL